MIWLLGGYMWLFIHRPFEVWPALGPLQLERAYMILLIVCWAGAARKQFVPNRLHLAFAVFALALLISWFVSPYLDHGMDTVENYAKVGIFYVLVISTIRDEESLRKLVLIFVSVVTLYLTHSLWEYVHGRHEFRMGIQRMVGVDDTYKDPNALAATLVYSLPLVAALWPLSRWGGCRLLLLYFVLAAVTAIILTGSRAGFVGLGALGFLWVLSTRRRAPAAMLFVTAMLVVWVLTPEDLKNRFLTLVDPSFGPANAQESALGRTQGYVEGLKLWAASPVTGFGPNSFAQASGHGFQAHNLYGQTVGELGALGACGLLAIVLAFMANAAEVRRFYRNNPEAARGLPYHLTRAVSVTIVLLLLMGFSGHNLYRFTWMWFGAFQVIAVYCLRVRQKQDLEVEASYAY